MANMDYRYSHSACRKPVCIEQSKVPKRANFATSYVQQPKIFQLQGGFAPLTLTRSSAPGLRRGLGSQTPVIGSRSALAIAPKPSHQTPPTSVYQLGYVIRNWFAIVCYDNP